MTTENTNPGSTPVDNVEPIPTTTITKTMYKPLAENDKRLPIPLTVKTRAHHLDNMSRYTNFDPTIYPGAKEWQKQIFPALSATFKDDWLSNKSSKGDWRQGVPHEGVTLSAVRHGFNAGPGSVLSGEQALSHVQYIFGVGIYVTIPLWHSGIWITIKAPMDSELLALERMIAEEKLMLGRLTTGFVFSNASVYISQHLFNFIIDHIYDCSVKDYSRDMLRSLILQTDFQTLVWGLCLAIYPDGWPVAVPCTTNPERCMHVQHDVLDLGKINIQNLDDITPAMRKHMAIRNNKFTPEQIVAYQQANRICEQREIEIQAPHGVLKIVLSVPSVQKHIDCGDRWISDIKTVINGIFDETDSMSDIDEYALKHSLLTTMREFSHWVKQIHIDDLAVMSGDKEIDGALEVLSSSKEAVDIFMQAIRKYIEDCTVSFIGVSNYDCPKCGEPTRSRDNIHPQIIPIDMLTLFFALQARRLMRASIAKTKKSQ